MEEHGAAAIGVNCSLGPDQLEGVIARIKDKATVPIIAKPNAGLPGTDRAGNVSYSMDEATFAQHMKKLVTAGAGIIGGCCGTTPAYIAELKKSFDKQRESAIVQHSAQQILFFVLE